jgi:hypothetical protein
VNSLGFLKETTVEKKKRVLAGLHEQYKWFTNARCCLSYNYVTTMANDVIELTLIPSVPNVVNVTNYLTKGIVQPLIIGSQYGNSKVTKVAKTKK